MCMGIMRVMRVNQDTCVSVSRMGSRGQVCVTVKKCGNECKYGVCVCMGGMVLWACVDTGVCESLILCG